MDLRKVVVAGCASYEQAEVMRAVRECLEPLGGIERFARKGETIFVKLNLIMPLPPSKAATTHPAVAAALCRLVQETGAKVVLGDCPGYPFTGPVLRSLYRVTGIEEVALETGAELNFDTSIVTVGTPEGKVAKSLPVAAAIARADGIINVPKLKTHGFTLITAAVKNMFGVIPGLKKAEYHAKMPDLSAFSKLLVDIASGVKTRLNVMDAVLSMEGPGPTRGKPIHTGMLLASEDPFSLDVVGAKIAGIDPSSVSTITEAAARGLGPSTIDEIEVLGDLMIPSRPFELPPSRPASNPLLRYLPKWAADAAVNLVRPAPLFDPRVCTGCRTCLRQCPVSAITMDGRLPRVDLSKCIRCFCCHELCPEGAVTVQRPWLGRLIMR